MIVELIALFCFAALLFFILSALVSFKYIWLVVPLNVLFLATVFYSFVHFVGTAIPMGQHIPFIAAQTFTENNIADIYAQFETDTEIHFVVQQKNGEYKYLTFPRTPELEAQLADAENAADAHHKRVKIVLTDTLYGPDAGSPFADEKGHDGFQENMGEAKPAQQDGVEVHGVDNSQPVHTN